MRAADAGQYRDCCLERNLLPVTLVHTRGSLKWQPINKQHVKTMKKLLIAVCFTAALAIAANAAEGEAKKEGAESKKPSAGQEQKAIRKELTEKYDADKNGRLNKDEKAKMTPEDAEKYKNSAPPKKPKAADAGEAKKPEDKKQ